MRGAILGLLAFALAGFPSLADARLPTLTAKGAVTATCADSMRGIGIPLREKPTASLGRFGIFEFVPDFRDLVRHDDSLLKEKAPVGVTPGAPITLKVPTRERNRVALSYRAEQRQHTRLAAVTFEPCPSKERTAWAGGLVLRDRKTVTLLVSIEGGPDRRLVLGRPKS